MGGGKKLAGGGERAAGAGEGGATEVEVGTAGGASDAAQVKPARISVISNIFLDSLEREHGANLKETARAATRPVAIYGFAWVTGGLD